MIVPNQYAYFEIVDKRLTKLEKAYDEIAQILTSLSMDIKHIIEGKDGGKTNGIKEKSNKSS